MKQALLRKPDIQEEIDTDYNIDGVLRDILDGEYAKTTAVFYWMLINVHPAHRSSFKFIQLLAVVNANILKKYGINHILSTAVTDLKTLGSRDY